MFPLLVVKLKELSPDTMVGGSTNITSEPTGQPAVPQEQRLHITDRISHIRFLVDSGSVVSVIPRTLVRQKTTLMYKLQIRINRHLGLKRSFASTTTDLGKILKSAAHHVPAPRR